MVSLSPNAPYSRRLFMVMWDSSRFRVPAELGARVVMLENDGRGTIMI